MVKECKDYPYSSYNEYANLCGVAHNSALKAVYGSPEDYVELFCESVDRKFMDIDGNKVEDQISNGLSAFIKQTNYHLFDILSDRIVLRKVFIFLKEECNINYIDIGKYFCMSKSIMKAMISNK